MSARRVACVALSLSLFLGSCSSEPADSASPGPATTNAQAQEEDARFSPYLEENNQIRRDKFDLILPQVMRERGIDMWIHVMRIAIPDPFGAEDLGSTSGVFVFTDRGGDRIERAILGRRWGGLQRETVATVYKDPIEELGVYDIVGEPVFVQQPVSIPETEYDYRFEGLGEFVETRDPQRIAVNFQQDLGPYVTYVAYGGIRDGLSHTDYLLLAEELGDEYASRLVSSEYLIMDYIESPVPSEVELLKKMRQDELERVERALEAIEPGVTRNSEAGVTVFRRMSTGLSQRGRSAGWENSVIQEGDILAAPSQGVFAYVLREGETAPPPEIQRLWADYRKIDRILAETIKAGLTPREIMHSYEQRFEEEGIIVRDPQLHMVQPKNDFHAYSEGLDPTKTQLAIDLHSMGKGARERKFDIYVGPRIGSNGPDWTHDVPLSPNHYFVLEYFAYIPSLTSDPAEDQYLLFWNHEQAIATEDGVEYLSPSQEELYLIR